MANKSKQGFSASLGVVMVIFVTLVGALGYQYAMNYKATVANSTSNKQIAAETMSVPEISSADDLAAASDALDKASVDTLSTADLEKLEKQVSSF